METQPHLDDMQMLLLMAAAKNDLRPGIELRANCVRVIHLALRWAGQLSPDVEAGLQNDFEYHPVVKTCYGALIRMIQHQPSSAALMEGAGNFGTPENPIAMPTFTACRLTPRGEKLADELLTQYPERVLERLNTD